MMRSPLGKIVAVLSWLITGLVSFNEGLEEFGYGAKTWKMFAGHPKLMMYCHYIAGIAGLLSLIMLVISCVFMGCHCCGIKNCLCCKKGVCEKGSHGVCPKCGANPCRCSHM